MNTLRGLRKYGILLTNQQKGAFFGITIHAEKEILMIVVEKDIRDQVLHALYKQMGMQQKGARHRVFTARVGRGRFSRPFG